ncbi:MAG: hypothetical protein CMP72_01065, partial [Flavobacteriales bacterium]|nr:hypothetical protein [Flavobacteriales bacterium]
MRKLKSILTLIFAKYIFQKNKSWIENPVDFQKKIMQNIVRKARKTKFGIDHCFNEIKSYSDFKKNIPIRDYEGLSNYIELIKNGETNVLWPGIPIYFCKTSGTTSGTKYIPLTKDSLKNQINTARDAILTYIYETKNASIYNGKMIFIQGSPDLTLTGAIPTGRLSGIVAHHIPKYLKKNR